jgi:3D (Asp-Asp-Asp) domain-containing protein
MRRDGDALVLIVFMAVVLTLVLVGSCLSDPRRAANLTPSRDLGFAVSVSEADALPRHSLQTPPTTPSPSPSAGRASRSRVSESPAASPRRVRLSGTRTLSVTAYICTGNRTASGSWPRVGDAASNDHPFGTRLYVEGFGVVTVRDRIGHSSELDVYMGCGAQARRAALNFGRRSLKVSVVQ